MKVQQIIIIQLINCKRVCIFFFLFSLPSFVSAQHYEFKNLNSKNGLIGSNVYCSVEDEKGFMWFATDKAICRYDGHNMKAFGQEEGYTESGAYHIYKDRKNTLWFISFNFKLFRFDGIRFHEFTGIAARPCWVTEDSSGYFWIGTRNCTFYKVEQTKIIDSVTIIKSEINYNILYNFIVTEQNEIIVSSYKKRCIITKFNDIQQLGIPYKSDYSLTVRLFQMRNGNILISSHQGLYNYSPSKKILKFIYSLNKNEIFCFYEDDENNLIWVGTSNGAFCFKINGSKIISCKEYFRDKIVLSIKKNKAGIYFYSTLGFGTYYCSYNSQHFSKSDGLKSDDLHIVKNASDDIYFFYRKGVIDLINKKRLKKMHQKIPQKELLLIHSVIKTNDNILYIHTNNYKKLFQIKERNFYMLQHSDSATYAYFENKSSLYQYNWNGIIYRQYPPKFIFNKPYFSAWYFNIGEQLKLGHFRPYINLGDTVIYYLIRNGYLKIIERNSGIYFKADTTCPYNTSGIDLTQNGNVILSTKNGGIIIIKGKQHNFINESSGLISNYCNKIYYKDHKIWVCTNNGLSKVVLNNEDSVINIENFNSNNLLISNEVRDVLEYKGDIYVATDQGVSIFNEAKAKESSVAPGIYIKSLAINNHDTFVNNYFSLPFNQNNISLTFSSISFNSSNRYKYKLEGIDDEFHITTENNIQFASLAPGIYKFIVFAQNNYGKWSTIPATINFVISPPFWRTLWFIIVEIIVSILLIYGGISYRFALVKRKNELRQRITDSELKALRLHMNPHFIFNTLNSLQSFVFMNKPLEANNYISKFSKLMRWVMSYSDKQEITLQEEFDFLNTYIQLEQLRFEESFVLTVEIDPNLDPQDIHIPPFLIQPFIENAIKYGISERKEKGVLTISYIKANDSILVTIQDNGPGRDEVKRIQDESPRKTESTGIKYTEERIRLLLDDNKIKHPVIITDLYEGNMPVGTKVELIIPILK